MNLIRLIILEERRRERYQFGAIMLREDQVMVIDSMLRSLRSNRSFYEELPIPRRWGKTTVLLKFAEITGFSMVVSPPLMREYRHRYPNIRFVNTYEARSVSGYNQPLIIDEPVDPIQVIADNASQLYFGIKGSRYGQEPEEFRRRYLGIWEQENQSRFIQ